MAIHLSIRQSRAPAQRLPCLFKISRRPSLLVYLQAADPVAAQASSRCRNWRPLVQFRGRVDGAHGGIEIVFCVWKDDFVTTTEPVLPEDNTFVYPSRQ